VITNDHELRSDYRNIKRLFMEMTYAQLEAELIDIYERDIPPAPSDMTGLTAEANDRLMREDPELRPRDESGLPGGIIFLKHDMPSILVPDIHARLDFLLSVLLRRDDKGEPALKGLLDNELQIICLGDGMHSEGRAYKRWNAAAKEFFDGYRGHVNMDEEMRESLGVIEMVMRLKNALPGNFHFLKGNHENVTNEEGNGNHPYLKYAFEGDMVASYLEKFYGLDFIREYYQYERNLPLLAVGENFLASHAEPAYPYSREEIVNYRTNPIVVEGLTWTENGAAENGSVAFMLEEYLGPLYGNGFYLGGHRPAGPLYGKRAGGKYIQINDPKKFIIAIIDPSKDFNPDEDVIEIENLA
jgi:hypothetical protein